MQMRCDCVSVCSIKVGETESVVSITSVGDFTEQHWTIFEADANYHLSSPFPEIRINEILGFLGSAYVIYVFSAFVANTYNYIGSTKLYTPL